MEATRTGVAGVHLGIVHVGDVGPALVELRLGMELLDLLAGPEIARGRRCRLRVPDVAERAARPGQVTAGRAQAVEGSVGDWSMPPT